MPMNPRMRTRILLGSVMLVGVIGLLYLDWWLGRRTHAQPGGSPLVGLPLAALLVVLVVVASGELQRLAAAAGIPFLRWTGLAAAIALVAMPYWWRAVGLGGSSSGEVLAVLGIGTAGMFAEQMIRWRTADAIRRLGVTLLTVIYLGVGGAIVMALRMDRGVPAVVLFLGAVKFTDIGAYFTGSAIGRHKMIPWLSPGKTWEGLAGGLIVAAGISVLITWALRGTGQDGQGMATLALWKAAIFGVVVGGVGQFADLCESLLKRSAAVKDSGALVPEFGGVLDIIDSPLLSAPVAFLLLKAML